ncbi:uncharacterized protein [Cicer arietinum]|uniref:Uncharacterized protein LOC101510324 n=1 Tax=Cicer arietinum TaxID=3827 RepID=A0A1S2YX56_CICAR|nr:uncharacterized protein LOC101510324 [Cicer arietinum]
MIFSMFARKGASIYNQNIIFKLRGFNIGFKSLTTLPNKDHGAALSSLSDPPSEYNSNTSLHLSHFFSNSNHKSNGFDIELVDSDAWRVSSVVAQAWQGRDLAASVDSSCDQHIIDELVDARSSHVEDELDFEDIDNMRVRGNLFYKLERSSMEFEEYNLEFYKKKSSKKKNDKTEVIDKGKAKAKSTLNATSKDKKLPKVDELGRSSKSVMAQMDETNDVSSHVNKRQRIPTFNQLTGPYHEPFCLDIYISKASVRACIVHRVTSKVVVVAHSISKDLKFDLTSTKNKTTCAAVGKILAQRALADDIHDVIYTPRKGERVEGKLQIVLKSIIDGGINVKLKIKQRPKKKSFSSHLT